MSRLISDIDPLARGPFFGIIIQDINHLLDVGLSIERPVGEGFESFVRWAALEICDRVAAGSYPYGKDETLALVSLLSTDKANPVERFVVDLAEIRFLAREKRSEYLAGDRGHPPYKIGKLMLEYALKSVELDAIVGALSKGFCAAHCDKLPVGCCYILGYDMGLVPETMLKLQRLEALRQGHRFPAREDKCRYHTATGCVIGLFKSPACIGYLCDDLTGYLDTRFAGPGLDAFYEALARFRNCDIDRKSVFEAMDRVVEAGRKLLER